MPPLSHPSPTVRALQQQYLQPSLSQPQVTTPPTSTSRPPRRASSSQADRKRRRLMKEEEENGSEAGISDECDRDDDDEDDDSDLVMPSPVPRRKSTSHNIPTHDASGRPLSAAEIKHLRRQQQNRDAAATSRNRKKVYLQALETQTAQLSQENGELKSLVASQKKQIEQMKLMIEMLRTNLQQEEHSHVIPHREEVTRTSSAVTSPDPHSPVSSASSPSSVAESFVHSSAPTTPMSPTTEDDLEVHQQSLPSLTPMTITSTHLESTFLPSPRPFTKQASHQQVVPIEFSFLTDHPTTSANFDETNVFAEYISQHDSVPSFVLPSPSPRAVLPPPHSHVVPSSSALSSMTVPSSVVVTSATSTSHFQYDQSSHPSSFVVLHDSAVLSIKRGHEQGSSIEGKEYQGSGSYSTHNSHSQHDLIHHMDDVHHGQSYDANHHTNFECDTILFE